MITYSRLSVVVAIVFTSAAWSRPAPPFTRFDPVARAATWIDVASEFRLVYNITNSCPQVMTFDQPEEDQRRVGILPMSGITEDGFPCSGASPMEIVTEATIETPGLLEQVGLSGFQEALDENLNAYAVMRLSEGSNLLVGWHGSDRACDMSVYPPTTIYFFIREEEPFPITLSRGDRTDVVTIPSDQTALLIIPLNANKLCLFSDKASNPEEDVTLTVTGSDGDLVTTVLTPAGLPTTEPETDIPAPNPGSSASPFSSASPSLDGDDPGPSVEEEDGPYASTSPLPTASSGTSPPIGGDGGVVDGDDPEPSVEEEDGPVCFPGSSRMRMSAHRTIQMSALRVASPVYSGRYRKATRVLMFTHRDSYARASFIRLVFADGATLTLSPGHYVPRLDGLLRAAAAIQPGDALMYAVSRAPRRVVAVSRVCAVGLFNPQTSDGWIGVDGTLASTYTTAINPIAAHFVLTCTATFLTRFSRFAEWLSQLLESGAPALAALLPGGEVSLMWS